MVYITGDTHIPTDIHKMSTSVWPEQKGLTKKDYVIVCGDFGLLWNYRPTGMTVAKCSFDDCWNAEEQFWYKWLNGRNYTTLWIDGNHENYQRLKKYPVSDWKGGKVQKISDSIIHLMRGQVYDIDGNIIFTMGGAESHDRGPATGTEKKDLNKIWWNDEVPSEKEWSTAKTNLAKVNNSVDYIISHEAPGNVRIRLGFDINGVSNRLWQLGEKTDYDRWYCGHLHRDAEYGRVRILYNDIIRLGN